jgi:hypothetical protein
MFPGPPRTLASSGSPIPTTFVTSSKWPRARYAGSGDACDGGVPALRIHGERARPGDAAHGDGERAVDIARVQRGKVETWVQSAGKPNEQAMKNRPRGVS